MKKITFSFKSLLIAAGLLIGSANAWATDEEVTLSCTSSITIVGQTSYGTNGSDYSNLIRMNSWAALGGAGAIAFTLDSKWDASKVKSATLQLYMNSKANRSRSGSIYIKSLSSYPNLSSLESTSYSTGKHIVYKESSSSNKRYVFTGTTVATVAASALDSSDPIKAQYFDVDLTTYIQSLTTKSVGDLVYLAVEVSDFALEGTIGAYGNENAPKLVITYTDETLYTASFTANSGAITPTITVYSDAARTSLVTNGTLHDKTTYYYRATLHGYNNYEGSFTVNGNNPSESFTMTAAATVETLTVKAKIGSSSYNIKSIDLDDKYVGDAYSFVYPKYYLLENTLYETAQGTNSNGWYKWNGTLSGNTVEIEYNTTAATNVVYYKEGEDIEGMEESTPTNAGIRCSNGKGGRSDDLVTLKNLGAGIYKIASGVWGGSGASFAFQVAGENVYTNSTTGSLNTSEGVFSIVSGTADVKVKGTSTSGKALDYVYIQKLAESEGLIFNGDFSNETWNAGWLGTGSDKKVAFVKQTADGFTGNIAEMWAGGTGSGATTFSAEGNIYQVLINVPAGDYVVSANILNNVEEGAAVLYAKVGSAEDVTTAAAGLATKTEKTLAFTVSEVSNVKIGYKTTNITDKTGWIAVDDFRFVVPVTITEAGWATLYTPYALDFSDVDGLTAYTASLSGSTITLNKVNDVPANTGVVLKGEANTYNIPVIASSSTDKGVLIGKATETTNADTEPGTGKAYYILTKSGSEAKFTPASGTIAAGKAYLEYDWTDVGSSVKALSIVFDDGEATGIAAPEVAEKAENGVLYNLNGQQVTADFKGIVIKNGKKFYNK